ncbi:VanZ family protein [Prauserella sp. ASG 168]|uniref:VanZ family protein n=2 Tax=Prauserella cavernicola TaxID=2800127 RepID=A0A934QQL6_9PSEU|nr:VanZ family protein [Prauserella cavernicola]
MITNLLVEHASLVFGAAVLISLACAAVGYLLLRWRRWRTLWLLAALALVPVAALTLVPATSQLDTVRCTVQFAVPTPGRVELVANVALFVPPVYFAALALRRPLPALATGAVLSAGIEALQALVPAIGRACDTNDWAMNTLGALVAAVLAFATTALAGRASGGGDAGSDGVGGPPDVGGQRGGVDISHGARRSAETE